MFQAKLVQFTGINPEEYQLQNNLPCSDGLTRFDPPIIYSISNEFALSEKYVEFWYTNLELTTESSHYLMWLKSLCSWIKASQSTVVFLKMQFCNWHKICSSIDHEIKNIIFSEYCKWFSRTLSYKEMTCMCLIDACHILKLG